MISHAKISRHRRMFKTLTGLSGDGRTTRCTGREPKLCLLEQSMLGSGRTTSGVVREPSLGLMEESMSGNSGTTNLGMEPYTTKTGM